MEADQGRPPESPLQNSSSLLRNAIIGEPVYAKPWQEFVPRAVTCLRSGYSLSAFGADFAAGLTVGIVALPLAMALAIASGVPPERGLYTAIIAGFLISALGGSKFQIGGPTAAFATIVYEVVLKHGYDGLVTATLMAGVMLMLLGFFRFGSLIKFIPYPVTTGLTTGIALLILSTQVKDFFGLAIDKVPSEFPEKWAMYAAFADTLKPATTAVAMLSLVALVLLRRYFPKIPGAILVVIAASAVVKLFGLPIETIGSRFGEIPSSLPSPVFPPFSFEKARLLIPEATAIAILAAIESLLSAVVADGMGGDRHSSNGELVAQGVANIGSVVFGGIPATGAFARTATNIKSGARSPVAGMVHAVVLLIFMAALAPYASLIPLPTLAAILVLVAWNISELDHFRMLLRAPRSDVAVLLATFLITVLTDITVAVEVGIVMAALLFMRRMSEVANVIIDTPLIDDASGLHPSSLPEPDILMKEQVPESVEIFELTGPLFFGIADRLKDTLNFLQLPPKVFILRMRHVPVVDATGLHALEELYYKCKRQKIVLILSGVREAVDRSLVKIGLDKLIGRDNIHENIHSALAHALRIASPEQKSELDQPQQ